MTAGLLPRAARGAWTREAAAGRFAHAPVHPVVDPRTVARSSDDLELLARLRAGDERAFKTLVERHHATMVAVARAYVRTAAVAEEVAQEAWLGALKGLDRFEGRSSLKTWILRIVVNTAISRGTREARSVPFSSFAATEADEEASVDAERFRGSRDPFPGHWRQPPADWGSSPEAALLGRETLGLLKRAIRDLPTAQRIVITMRDIQGCSAEEVCEVLQISTGNQRVLLHRARARVRALLEGQLDE